MLSNVNLCLIPSQTPVHNFRCAIMTIWTAITPFKLLSASNFLSHFKGLSHLMNIILFCILKFKCGLSACALVIFSFSIALQISSCAKFFCCLLCEIPNSGILFSALRNNFSGNFKHGKISKSWLWYNIQKAFLESSIFWWIFPAANERRALINLDQRRHMRTQSKVWIKKRQPQILLSNITTSSQPIILQDITAHK